MTPRAVVLLMDASLGVAMKGMWEEACATALALGSAIAPGELTGVAIYDYTARNIELEQLNGLQYEAVYGANLQDGLRLATSLLAEGGGERRLLVVADESPSARVLPNGEMFFTYPSDEATTAATLDEARACIGANVRIDVLLLKDDSPIRPLAEEIAAASKGRVVAATPGMPPGDLARSFLSSIGVA